MSRGIAVWLACVLRTFCVQADPSGPVLWTDTVPVAAGGWGRMIRLADGNWLCVSTLFPANAPSTLAILRGAPDGTDWHVRSHVAEPGRVLDNGELVALPGGAILLTMRSLVPGSSYRLPVYRSINGGLSWTLLSLIDAQEGPAAKGLWEPDFQVLDDGRLTVTYSNEGHDGYSQLISARTSADGGATWGEESWAVAEPGGGDLRPGMSQMARTPIGEYILVYEVVGLGNADVYCKFSADGIHWPQGLGARIPCHHAGPFVTATTNGRLLLTSCENQVSFSEDFGRTWQMLTPPAWDLGFQFTWPAVYDLSPHGVTVLAVNPSLKARRGILSPPAAWPNPFVADFDDGTDAGWTRYGSGFSLVDGHYRLAHEGSYGKAMTGDGFWSDGTVEADILLETPGNAGLLVRTTNPDYAGPDHALGYYVGLDSDGEVVLGSMQNGWTRLASAPAPVEIGTWHHLRIELQGPLLRVYVDSPRIARIAWEDETHARGQIGVRAFQCNARFDHVSYTDTAPLRLDLQSTPGSLEFAWPQSARIPQLHTTADPSAPAPWTPVAATPTLIDDRWRLALPLPHEPTRAYRLQKP